MNYTKHQELYSAFCDNNFKKINDISANNMRITFWSNGTEIFILQEFIANGDDVEGYELYKRAGKTNLHQETLNIINGEEQAQDIVHILKDKLHRRNLQIANLKKQLGELKKDGIVRRYSDGHPRFD